MKFYINLGKDKNKANHLKTFGSDTKFEFSIVVANKDKNGKKDYAYLPAETWNKDLIACLVEGKQFKTGEFHFRFYKDKYHNPHFVLVLKSLSTIEETKQEETNTLTNDIDFDISKELGDLF